MPFRPYLPDQDFLLPPSLRDWLPESHLAYFVSDVVDQLDLKAIYAKYGDEERGQPPYHPKMMTKVLLYAYCVGVFSSRKIQRRIREDIAFRMLAAGNEPDFRTIADFRKIHLEALQGFFDQVLKIALETGTMKLGRVALDGSKVRANASKHKAMSYGRVQEEEQRLKGLVKEMLQRAEAEDAEEDARYEDRADDADLPTELQRHESRLERIREAKKAIEQRAREKAVAEGASPQEARQAKPAEKDQYNFTDPQSRIMRGADGFVQAYNTQLAVESDFQLIVGQAVTQDTNDKQQVEPMVETIEQQSGQRPEELLADTGYCSEQNLEYLESAAEPKKKIEAYVATERQKHGEEPKTSPQGRLSKNATRVDRMRRKLQTKAGKAVYAARKGIVEPVFGQIKQARGFRQFLLRGLKKVQGEWALVCLTHNILKLYRMCYE